MEKETLVLITRFTDAIKLQKGLKIAHDTAINNYQFLLKRKRCILIAARKSRDQKMDDELDLRLKKVESSIATKRNRALNLLKEYLRQEEIINELEASNELLKRDAYKMVQPTPVEEHPITTD